MLFRLSPSTRVRQFRRSILFVVCVILFANASVSHSQDTTETPLIDPYTGEVVPVEEYSTQPLLDPYTGEVVPEWQYIIDWLIDPYTGFIVPEEDYTTEPLIDPYSGEIVPAEEYVGILDLIFMALGFDEYGFSESGVHYTEYFSTN